MCYRLCNNYTLSECWQKNSKQKKNKNALKIKNWFVMLHV